MARVTVLGVKRGDAGIVSLKVSLVGLPDRILDRDTAIRWARDQHSFLTPSGVAVQLVGVDDDGGQTTWFLREDNQPEPYDHLPSVASI